MLNRQSVQQIREKIEVTAREEICSMLVSHTYSREAQGKLENNLVDEASNPLNKKMFIELIQLDAIKCILTFRLETSELEFDITDPNKKSI